MEAECWNLIEEYDRIEVPRRVHPRVARAYGMMGEMAENLASLLRQPRRNINWQRVAQVKAGLRASLNAWYRIMAQGLSAAEGYESE